MFIQDGFETHLEHILMLQKFVLVKPGVHFIKTTCHFYITAQLYLSPSGTTPFTLSLSQSKFFDQGDKKIISQLCRIGKVRKIESCPICIKEGFSL